MSIGDGGGRHKGHAYHRTNLRCPESSVKGNTTTL